MSFAYGETVVRRRAPLVTDRYNAKVRDWDAAAETFIHGCGIADGGSTEPVEVGRTAVVCDFEIYAPAGTDVAATDRLVVRGQVCEVEGQPFDWRHPQTGWRPGTVIRAKIVSG
ncbi:hypothetical protein GCM10023340_08480 [Nocardioides marinquilinus]|uniref:Head-to-tail stopper n=1 Tax=Nocardioides marinquilinus TaxID=1210400 RepID=A0ABP9PA67_9ACTN